MANMCERAAGASAVACAVFLFMLAVPALITSLVLFYVSNGNLDQTNFSPDYDECTWSKWYDDTFENHWNTWNRWSGWSNWNTWNSWNNWNKWSTWNNWIKWSSWDNWTNWDNWNSRNKRDTITSLEHKYCKDGKKKWENWTDTKKDMRAAAIILLVLCLLLLSGGVALAVMICWKKKHINRGVVHSRGVVLQCGTAVGQSTVNDGTAAGSHERGHAVVSPLLVPPSDPKNTAADMPPPYSQLFLMASNSANHMPEEQHAVEPSAPEEFQIENY